MIYTIESSLYIRIGVTEFQVVMITGTAISDFNPSVDQRTPGQKLVHIWKSTSCRELSIESGPAVTKAALEYCPIQNTLSDCA